MKRKSLLFLLLMAVFAPWAAVAQETLTVYDQGDLNANTYVPTYGNWADAYTKCEFVMNAEDETYDLSEMAGGTITKIKFYVTTVGSGGSGWEGNTFQIFMKEISETTISAWQGIEGATIVYEGSLDTPTANNEYEIEFTTPYEYNGGNLLVGFYNTTSVSSGYKNATFSGKNAHPYMTTGKTIALTTQTFVGKVMCLLFNMLSSLVIAFLPRSKCLLIS